MKLLDMSSSFKFLVFVLFAVFITISSVKSQAATATPPTPTALWMAKAEEINPSNSRVKVSSNGTAAVNSTVDAFVNALAEEAANETRSTMHTQGTALSTTTLPPTTTKKPGHSIVSPLSPPGPEPSDSEWKFQVKLSNSFRSLSN